jgi:Amidohydrolase
MAGGIKASPGQTQHAVPWSSGTEPPKLKAPPNACDCHMHIYDSRFPAAPNAVMPPPDASVDAHRLLQRRIGTARTVVVNPSTYGTDNSCTLDAMAQFGADARGIAVVDTGVTDAELKRPHDLGIRGIRFNLVQSGATTIDMLEPLSERVNDLGWHVQIHMQGHQIVEAAGLLQHLPSAIVFDHMARIPQPAGVNHHAFGLVLRLLDIGRTWVKRLHGHEDRPADLCRRWRGRPGLCEGGAGTNGLEQRLATPDPTCGSQAQRRDSVRPPGRLGAGRGDPKSHPGRQSDGALWVRLKRAQGQIYPPLSGDLKQPTDSGKSVFGNQSTALGKKIAKAIVTKKIT